MTSTGKSWQRNACKNQHQLCLPGVLCFVVLFFGAWSAGPHKSGEFPTAQPVFATYRSHVLEYIQVRSLPSRSNAAIKLNLPVEIGANSDVNDADDATLARTTYNPDLDFVLSRFDQLFK